MENGIKELSEAKLAQEEKNMELQESLGKVLGTSWRVETKQKRKKLNRWRNLSEHLQQADRELHASLSFGELCRQLQNKI